ncbi:MAG TPA: hypothetical protein VF982_00310 [Anaerolineales bacterium]
MTELTDLSETDASNTTITGIDIDEGCAPSGMNNAARNTLGLIRRMFKSTIFRVRDATDQTKLLAFDLSGITTATTRTLIAPNESGTIDLINTAQVVSGIKTFSAIPVLSGGGITFPATQVPSAGANTLDDYEEGTFTPIDASSASLSFASVDATYTKIGRVVFWGINVIYPATASGSSAAIGGLPFTTASNAGNRGSCSVGYTPVSVLRYARYSSSATTFQLFTSDGTAVSNSDLSNASVFFGGHYIV